MDLRLNRARGLGHLALTLNMGKETERDKEKEGKNSFVIFGDFGIQCHPRESESITNNRVLSQTQKEKEPSFSAAGRIQLS